MLTKHSVKSAITQRKMLTRIQKVGVLDMLKEGTYQGQWLNGMRHGYGVRQSVPYGMAAIIFSPMCISINSLRSDHSESAPTAEDTCAISRVSSSPIGRSGFVLCAHSEGHRKRKGHFRRSILSGLKLRRTESKNSLASQLSKQSSFCSENGMSTVSSGGSDINSSISLGEAETGGSVDATVTETFAGEWRNDMRSGWGVSQRSDGLHYEGEWFGNKRHGYGCTTFPDGSKEEGKYKQNSLVSGKRKNLIPIRTSKTREKVDHAVEAAEKARNIAKQKAEIALSRMSHARGKAEAAEEVAQRALEECHLARDMAKELSPSFQQYGNDLECQRPKDQGKKEKNVEVVSTGTDSPELWTPDTTPPDQTPNLSPILCSPSSQPCSPPTHRSKNTCFMRQSAVDDQGGAEIQVILEGRTMDTIRSGANSWTTELYPCRRGSKGESSRSTTPSLLEEEIGHIKDHGSSSGHHPWKNWSSNHKAMEHTSSEKEWDHTSSNKTSRKHVSLNQKRVILKEQEREYNLSNHIYADNDSSKFKPQMHIYVNQRSTGHYFSNHKTNEHSSSNHKPKELISANDKPQVSYHFNPQEQVSSYHKHEHGHSNHKPRNSIKNYTTLEHDLNAHQTLHNGANSTLEWTAENNSQSISSRSTLQEKGGDNDYLVEMRFQPQESFSQQNTGMKCSGLQGHNFQRLRQRNHEGKEWSPVVRKGSMDSVQMLDTLNVGIDVEEWPLHRDINLSPPLTSSQELLDQEREHLNLVKKSSGSGSILVVLVILLNIGVAILFIQFFI